MFSPNGIYLLSIGDDDNHSLAIYDWANKHLIASCKVDKSKVCDCGFKNDSEFVTCGLDHMKYWSFNGTNISFRRGFLEAGQFEPLTCITFAFVGKLCVTGTVKGNLIVWADSGLQRKVLAHKSQVWVLIAKGNGLVSGGQDGNLIVWSNEFKQLSSIDVSKLTTMDPGVRAVDVNGSGDYVIGTHGGEIISVQQGKTALLVRGHHAGQLWGLCVSPNENKFATCGGDKTLRVWQLNELLLFTLLPEDARAIDWASNNEFIAVGSVEGFVYCFNPNDNLSNVSKLQSSFDKDQWIEDIKISPNNTMIAFGVRKGISKIEVMKVNEKGDGLSKCYFINAGLTTGLAHLDWDVTSTFIVINGQFNELKFLNVSTQTIQSGTASKDIDWYTWSCVLGFPVQGILPLLSDATDVNCACRSHNRKLIATGDDYSKVKIFKYPSAIKHAGFKEYKGHSGYVTKAMFTYNDEYLITIGGYDKTVIVWSTETLSDNLLESVDYHSEPDAINKEMETVYNEIDTTELDKKIAELQKKITKRVSLEQICLMLVPGITDDKSDILGTKTWIGAVREPTGFIKSPYNQCNPPKVKLSLDYVYGYNSKDSRNNVGYLKTGEIIFPIAATAIMLNKETNTQRFFLKHINSIMSLALHPDGVRVATGEFGIKPCIFVWNSNTCLPIICFRGHLEKGVKSLCFSPSGEYLAAVDISSYHALAVYDLRNGELICATKTDPVQLVQVAFKDNEEFFTIGVRHFMNWKLLNSGLNCTRGSFKSNNSILGCIAIDGNLVLTGNAIGEIYQWQETKILLTKKIHIKTIDCISIFENLYILQ